VREVQEVERARIARELHDGIGQSLTAIKLRLESAALEGAADLANLGRTLEIVGNSIEEVRRMAHDLHPPQLEYLGLESALRWQIERQMHAGGPEIEIEFSELPPLAPLLRITCFRVVQEAVNNAIKHGKPRNIEVTLKVEGNQLIVRVRDDGCGFEADNLKLGGLGLLGIRERVELAGGSLSLRSAPGTGTELVVVLPLRD
jgi:two-component system sensor histidine kinase UhpB